MMPRLPCLLLIASLLAACVGGAPSGLEPGKTTLPQLLEQLGQPSMVWSEGDGSLQIEFARVAQGGSNFMARVDPNGVLLSLQQALTDARVASLQPGMSREQVRRYLGQPARIEFEGAEEVWHWPLDSRRPAVWQIDVHFGAGGNLDRVIRSRIRMERTAAERLADKSKPSHL